MKMYSVRLYIFVYFLLYRQWGYEHVENIGEKLLEYVEVWLRVFLYSLALICLRDLGRIPIPKSNHNNCYLSSHMCIYSLHLWRLIGVGHFFTVVLDVKVIDT